MLPRPPNDNVSAIFFSPNPLKTFILSRFLADIKKAPATIYGGGFLRFLVTLSFPSAGGTLPLPSSTGHLCHRHITLLVDEIQIPRLPFDMKPRDLGRHLFAHLLSRSHVYCFKHLPKRLRRRKNRQAARLRIP